MNPKDTFPAKGSDKTYTYHRHPAWSPTALKAAATGTMAAWWHKFQPGAPVFDPSPDMIKGDLVDALLLPPRSLSGRFAVYDTIARSKADGKRNVQEAQEAGVTPVTTEMFDHANRICDVLRADPIIGEILAAIDDAHSQQPHFWDDVAGRPCRCLPDIVTRDGRLFDLKKTRSAVPRRFYWQAKDLAYDLQMAHLAIGHESRHGAPPAMVGIIAFEWDEPFDRSVLILDEQDLATGRERREEAFRRIAECQAAGEWPSHGLQPFRPPASAATRPAEVEEVELF